LTAVYTAYLFAQAKARDLWQNPLLPPHLVCQALLLGSAALLPFAFYFTDNGIVSGVPPLLWTVAIASLIHVLMVWGEVSLTHPTSHARVAVWEMTNGRYRGYFWWGLILSVLGGALPLIVALSWLSSAPPLPPLPAVLGIAGVPFALIGLLLHEHAYVQAGQSVPLA
jgi:Ni/Fe-hydrogenase subunit HybB-like protein